MGQKIELWTLLCVLYNVFKHVHKPFTRAWSLITILAIFPLSLESDNLVNNIPVVFPSSQIKIWGKNGQGVQVLWSDKQTNIDYFLYNNSTSP